VIQLSAEANAAMYEDTSANPPANGAGPNLFVGRIGNNGGNRLRRSLLRFDVAGAIPAGAIIDSAELDVFVSQIPPSKGGFQSRLYRVTSPWSEGPADSGTPGGQGTAPSAGDTTWLHTNFPTAFWTIAGGDFVIAASASVLMSSVGPYTWSSAARGTASMELDVQQWLDDPSSNHGWIVRGVEDFGVQSARRINGRHNPTNPPVLRIAYTVEGGGPGGGAGPLAIPTTSGFGLAVLFALLGAVGWRLLRRR